MLRLQLQKSRRQGAVNVQPGVHQQVGAGPAHQAPMPDERAEQIRVLLADAGKKQRIRPAQPGRIHPRGIQKPQLPRRKIHLHAIMLQTIRPQNSLHRMPHRRRQFFEIIRQHMRIGQQRHVAQVHFGRRIHGGRLFHPPHPERPPVETFAQLGFQGFINKRHGRPGVHNERQFLPRRQTHRHP